MQSFFNIEKWRFRLHLKKEPNSCFINNEFHVGLKTWFLMSIMQWDICVNISQKPKINVLWPWSMKWTKPFRATCIINRHYENNTKDYLSIEKCSVQEAVYHILPELKLRRIFPAVYFVNTNPSLVWGSVLLSEKRA